MYRRRRRGLLKIKLKLRREVAGRNLLVKRNLLKNFQRRNLLGRSPSR